jgi:Mn-dependent DtxR family transcriptional regulator
LRTVLALKNGEGGVRLTDVARRLRVSKTSASLAVTKLEKDGFVTLDANRLISLTPDGEWETKRVGRQFYCCLTTPGERSE